MFIIPFCFIYFFSPVLIMDEIRGTANKMMGMAGHTPGPRPVAVRFFEVSPDTFLYSRVVFLAAAFAIS